MSRFWAAGGGSSSESSDSSSDSSVSSDDSSRFGGAAGAGKDKWVMSDDSDSEDSVRVVKSAKTRAFESFEANVKQIRNAMKIRDFAKVQNQFEELTKSMTKSKKLIDAHGGVPRFFVRILVDLEDFVKTSLADKAGFKKLSPTNGRALNRMKLTLRKHNKQYDAIMEEYRKNPVVSGSSSSEDSASSSDSDSDSDSDSSKSSSNSSGSSKSSKSSSSSSSSSSASKKSVSCPFSLFQNITCLSHFAIFLH